MDDNLGISLLLPKSESQKKEILYREIDRLVDYLLFYVPLKNISLISRSRIYHLYVDVTIAGEGLQSLGLCSVLRAFEQGGIFIVPHLL
jgi:hypothetical protein